MSRFVILRHTPGQALGRTQQVHWDWMFEREGVLRTFSTEVLENLERAAEIAAVPLADHRIEYLEREGEVSGNRGQVERVIGGTYLTTRHTEREFVASLRWQPDGPARRAEAEFYLSLPSDSRLRDSRDAWRLRLTPCR